MRVAILSKTANIGNSVADYLSRYDSLVYTGSSEIAEDKVLLPFFNYKENEITEHLKRLKIMGKELLCILQDYELSTWEEKLNSENIKYIINGQDSTDVLTDFLDGITKQERSRRRSFVAIEPVGGCGKTMISTYLAKRAAEEQRVRIIDWDAFSPSLDSYFDGKKESGDLVTALRQLRNNMSLDMLDYEMEAEKNLLVTNMSLNYVESSKWKPEHFLHIWEYYQKQPEQIVFYQLPNFPMLTPSAVALMRASDIILPIRAEQRAIEPARYFIDWLRKHRHDDMPEIHVIVNKYDENEAPIALQDIEKTLGITVEHYLPYVEDIATAVATGEILSGKGSRGIRKAADRLEAFYQSLAIRISEGEEESDKKSGFGFWRK
ncbi:hypothetical protein P9597_10805 [Aneurinibacillus migulanus]|uniref:AAA family ATPase n=1 Tax=Aneurinibacillus migulanus TaxID=47500 RepID=UPI002E1E4EF8|nr:hypothetical protein [Aneurinibacillus migulanus]